MLFLGQCKFTGLAKLIVKLVVFTKITQRVYIYYQMLKLIKRYH